MKLLKIRKGKCFILNIGDPNLYDFAPPRDMVEATYKAMLDN